MAPALHTASRSTAASGAPACCLASAATRERCARLLRSGVRFAASSRKAAVAARPPRACARSAERSSSTAIASLGSDAPCARCHARRSGSSSGSVTSARARWAAWRSSVEAARYIAERTNGCRKVTRASISSSPTPRPAPLRWARPRGDGLQRREDLDCQAVPPLQATGDVDYHRVRR